MEQHVDQHAVLNPMGDAPMASSVSAVVALPVDPTTPATAPLDDVTIGTGGSASDTATSVDNSASTQLLVTSDGSQASTLSADFGDFDATESSPESSTVIPTDDGSSGASSDDIPPGGVNTPAVPAPTPAPNVIHCGTPGCRRFPGSDPSGPLQVDQHICCGACRFSNGGTHTLACDSVNLAPAPIPPPAPPSGGSGGHNTSGSAALDDDWRPGWHNYGAGGAFRLEEDAFRLEEATADREHQLLLDSQMIMAEHHSLVDQHGGQQAALVSIGDAPMSGGASDQLLLESQTIMAEHLSLLEQHSDQQAILTSLGDAPTSCGSDAVAVPVVGPSVGAVGPSVASCGVRLFVVLLDPSAVLLLASAVGGPSGSTLRVVEDVDGSGIRAGDYLAAVNNARRFSSPRQAETIINNSRALDLHVRLVFIRSLSAPPISDTPRLAEDTVFVLPYTGAGLDALAFLGEPPALSVGASSVGDHNPLANRVLICPRNGCGRHAQRQAGDPDGRQLYCCDQCAVGGLSLGLEGHSARCNQGYPRGQPTGPPHGDDAHPGGPDDQPTGPPFVGNAPPMGPDNAHPHAPDPSEVGSFGTSWRSGAGSTSATETMSVTPDDTPESTGAPVNEAMIDEFLSVVRTGQPSEPSSALLLEQVRSSPAFLLSLESPGLFEICAGRGTLSDAYKAEGITPRLLSETDECDQRYLCFRFPSPALVLGDFFSGQWQCPASVLVVTGGISCAFCSPAGLQLGTRDLRSPISTDALPWAARYFNAAFADFENVPAIATADHGSVLRALDHNFATVGYERVPRVEGSPLGLEIVSPNLVGAPGVRDRASGHYELVGLDRLIGPCPPLQLEVSDPFTIEDILDAGPRDSSLFVEGEFVPIEPNISNPRFPIVAGFLHVGGPSVPIYVGSRVTARHLNGITWVVWAFLRPGVLLLFFDSRRDREWYELDLNDLEADDPLVHLAWCERVLDIRGVAAASTGFGVPFLGCAKQLWLVDGRVVSPSTSELWRIQEYNTDGINDFIVCNLGHLSDAQQLKLLRSMPGKGLPARLASAMAARTADRVRLLQAVVDGRIAPFSSSLESGLVASCIPFRPIEGSVLTFAVLVTWVDGVPRILADFKDAALPAFVANGAEARVSSLSHVDSIFSAASPSTPVPVGFLVDDFTWCRVIAVPLANHHPSQLTFGDLSWCTLSDLGGTPLRLIAFRALAAVASMLQSSLRDAMPAPALPGGAVAPRFVPQPPPTFAVDPVRWTRQIAECAAATSALRAALLSVSGDDADYYHEWAALVKDLDEASVPPNLRGADVNYGDPQYAHTPLAYRDSIPITVPASVPPEQRSSYRPRNITPDIFPVEVAKRWALWWPKVLYDLVRYRIDPDAARSFNEPFVVAQEELHPDARDIFWDLRFRRSDGSFAPLDFTRRMNTHLNTGYLSEQLAGFPDQEMVYMITVTGIDFKISHVAGQTVIFPHLESLGSAFMGVEKELFRLNELSFNEFFGDFPFLPWCALPNGAVDRQKENRKRRTTEAGAPRNELFDNFRHEVLPLNRRIGSKDLVDDASSRWRLPGLPMTTGHLTYECAVNNPSGRTPKLIRWPPEIKPRVEDVLHDITVLKHAASCLGEHVYVFTADAKDYFNQLALAQWVIPHVGLLWTAFDGHADYSCIAEYSLGFGYSCASNIAQRFAFGILDIFRRAFDADDAGFVDADRRRAPGYFAARDSVSSQTGRDECRLAVVHMYTDDPIFVVVSAARAVRVLRTWRRITRLINLTMAIAAKHQGGIAAVWLGLLQLTQLGALAIPLPKHSDAIMEVRALLRGDIFQKDRYQSIVGLLEHLLVYANGDRSAMAFMHAPIKALHNAGPTAPVHIGDDIRRQLVAWEARLVERAGIPAAAVFARSAFSSSVSSALPGLEYVISTDAASAGTTRPGIGGYCHGRRFRFPLDSSDVGGPFEIPVPVLEFIGIAFGICAFVPFVGGVAACITFGSDSITSVDAVLNMSAHAALMQVVHDGLLRTSEYASVRHKLRLGHIFGEGNVWADAESRGYDDVLAALSAQLGVTPSGAPVPPHAVALLNRVRSVIRNRPLTEDELRTSKAYSECFTGDGPAIIPPDDVLHVATTSSTTLSATPTADSAAHVVPPDARHACPIAGCPRRPLSDPRGLRQISMENLCCDACLFTDGRHHTDICDSANRSSTTASSPTPPSGDGSGGDGDSGRPCTGCFRSSCPANVNTSDEEKCDDFLAALSAKLGVTPSDAPVPPHAVALLNRVRSVIRNRPLTEGELRTSKAYSECLTGDGPVSLAVFAGQAVLPSCSRFPAALPSYSRVLAPIPPAADPPVRPSLAVFVAPVSQPTVLLTVSDAALESRPDARLHVTARFTERPAKPYVSVDNALAQVVDVLARDTSPFALRARDPVWLAEMARDIAGCVHDSVPEGTLKKDTFAWRQWMIHLDKFRSQAWRPDRNDLDSDGRARERFVFDSFFLEEYRRMVRSKATAKPQSALNNMIAVKRVMRRGGVQPIDTPSTNTILKGLLRQYVELHGAEILCPKRAEPLVASDMRGIFSVGPETKCGSGVVDWDLPRFRSFRAFLCTSRLAATRKADQLCKHSGSFTKASASRAHLSWRFRGVIKQALTILELRSLRPGDCAILTPVPVKNDPFAIFFGNHPIWLPYDASDPYNAAFWLADLELAFPVEVADRRSVPLFPGDDAGSPLTFSMADTIFHAVAVAGLGATRAAMLSLHSGRVFCACALLAQGAPRPMILALCRWRDERSLDVYARPSAAEYLGWMTKVSVAVVDSIAPRNMPQLDYDEAARLANSFLQANPSPEDDD